MSRTEQQDIVFFKKKVLTLSRTRRKGGATLWRKKGKTLKLCSVIHYICQISVYVSRVSPRNNWGFCSRTCYFKYQMFKIIRMPKPFCYCIIAVLYLAIAKPPKNWSLSHSTSCLTRSAKKCKN